MTGWRVPARTAAARARFAAAEADRRERPERYRLGADVADELVQRAIGERDAAVLGPAGEWRPGLEQYLASAAEDGRLNAIGIKTVLGTAVGKLRARLALDDATDARAEPPPLDPPIVIVGGWRTGSTHLFRLLGTDPQLRAPLPAELSVPWRFASLDPERRERLIDAGAAAHDELHLLNPDLATVHESGARLAEECVLAMGTTFRNWGFTSTTRLDGYARWLAGEDLAAEYARHRRVLELLDARDGRRWVLKAPAHTPELAHVAATYPGSTIVVLHRDVVQMLASGSSLFATFRATYSDDVDPLDVGRFQTAQTAGWFDRMLAFRASAAGSTVTVVDVAYSDLVADPVGVLGRIYDAAAVDRPHLDALIAADAAAHPHHAAGHRYGPDDFGLDTATVRERFAAYEQFVREVAPGRS